MRIVKPPIGQRVKDDRGSVGDRLIRSSRLWCGSRAARPMQRRWVGSKSAVCN